MLQLSIAVIQGDAVFCVIACTGVLPLHRLSLSYNKSCKSPTSLRMASDNVGSVLLLLNSMVCAYHQFVLQQAFALVLARVLAPIHQHTGVQGLKLMQ